MLFAFPNKDKKLISPLAGLRALFHVELSNLQWNPFRALGRKATEVPYLILCFPRYPNQKTRFTKIKHILICK